METGSIGRFAVRRRLGTGGFATVWLAHDPELDAPVAVKILADNWAGQEDIRRRFVDEARLLRRVDSDHVVRVYDIGSTDRDQPYFVMTFADGGCLEERLERTAPPWPEDQVTALVDAVAAGLDVLHRHGIVHRDVKPRNILLRSRVGATGDRIDEQQVLLGDLGVAKDLTWASGLTMPVGTAGYHAPEQGGFSEQVGPASDVYALAVVAGRLLGMSGPPWPLGPAWRALTAATEQDPDRRTGSASRFAAELREALSAAPVLVPPPLPDSAPSRMATVLLERAPDPTVPVGTAADQATVASAPAVETRTAAVEARTAATGYAPSAPTPVPAPGPEPTPAPSAPTYGPTSAPPSVPGYGPPSAPAYGPSSAPTPVPAAAPANPWLTADQRTPVPAGPLPARSADRPRRSGLRRWTAAAAAVLLIGGGAGTWYLGHRDTTFHAGRLSLTVPSGWTATGGVVVPGEAGGSGLRALSDDRRRRIDVALAASRTGPAAVANRTKHPECPKVTSASIGVGRLKGSAFRWTGCPSGVSVDEVGLIDPARPGEVVWLRVVSVDGDPGLRQALGGLSVQTP